MELLVVIGIIAVLISILLPSLNKARDSGRKIQCLSNLRQLCNASIMYSMENRQYIAPAYMPNVGTIEELLFKYVGARMRDTFIAPDVFYCPQAETFDSPPYNGYVLNPATPRYKGWSGYMFGYRINASIHKLYNPISVPLEKRTRCRKPSDFIEFCDLSAPRPQTSGPPTSGMATRNSFNPDSSSYVLGLIHNRQGCVGFLDGSARSFTRQFLHFYSVPGQEAPWN